MSDEGRIRYRVKVTSGDRSGQTFPLEKGGRITVGRRASNTIPVKEVQVSGAHAEIVWEEDGPIVRDLGSTNGTFLDGKKVQEVPLNHGDEIRIGSLDMVFEEVGKPAPESASPQKASHSSKGPQSPPPSDGEGGPSSLSAPKKSGKLVPILSLIGLLAVLGGAAFFYFSNPFQEEATVAALPPASGNLVGNVWSFEPGGDDDGRLEERVEGAKAFRRLKTGAHSGARGLSATLQTGERSIAAVTGIPVSAERKLSLSIFARASSTSKAIFGVEVRDESGRVLSSQRLASTSAETFQKLSGELFTPPNAATIDVILGGRGEGNVSFDDVEVMDVGSTTPGPITLGAFQGRKVQGALYLTQTGGARLYAGLPRLYVKAESSERSTGELGAGEFGGGRIRLPNALLSVEGDHVLEGGLIRAKLSLKDQVNGDEVALGFYYEGGGIRALTSRGVESQPPGAFSVEDVTTLLLGDGSSLLAINFDQPETLVSEPLGEGAFIAFSKSRDQVSYSIRGDFEAERIAARNLVTEAEAFVAEGRDGMAYAKASEVVQNLPFDQDEFDSANHIASRILGAAKSAQDSLETLVEAAQFLESPDKLAQARRRADEAASRFAGTPYEEPLAAILVEAEENLSEANKVSRERRAERLFRSGESLGSVSGRRTTSELILQFVQERYADTKWADEAASLLNR